ncbi:MAG: GTP-binding protein [Pseudomonadota bacterium]|nr:GTP-binding protein [Pseudomonadota bacterium]
MIERIPVTLLTGFLGSGKTTLLGTMLRTPTFANTAVLINELGAVGLDHHLARGASETMRLLENGCVCCSVRDDLRSALADLYWDRLHQRIPRFERVVIETTGLAEPAPLLQVLEGTDIVAERYRWAGVLCTVDSMHAQRELETRPEPARQIALADLIFMTKVDITTAAEVQQIEVRLRAINPVAAQFQVVRGEAPTQVWAALQALMDDDKPPRPAAPKFILHAPSPESTAFGRVALHAPDVRTFVVELAPMSRAALQAVLEQVTRSHGEALLRVKGIACTTDPVRAVVVQAVHEHLYPMTTLDRDVGTGAALAPALVFIIAAPSRSAADAIESTIRAELSADQSK